MIFFQNGRYLSVVLIVTIVIFVAYLISFLRKKRWLKEFGKLPLIKTQGRLSGPIPNIFKAIFVSASFCCLSLVILGPRWQKTETYYENEGLEIVFALDVSLSMLAEDVKPNRLQRAKLEIASLVNELENDYLGIVVFAGRAFSLLPYLTTDYDKVFLRILDMVNENYVRYIPYGTNIGNALMIALSCFSEEKRQKILIFLTDGEEQIAVRSQVAEASKLLIEREDTYMYMIGIGDPTKGSLIPKKDKHGNNIGFEEDLKGERIRTKPDPQLLHEIAKITGGTYIHDDRGNELKGIFRKVVKTHKEIVGIKTRNVIKDLSQYFLGCVLLFLVFSFLL